MKKLMIFLVFSSCFLEFSNAQQTQSDDCGDQMEIQKIDALLVDKMMFEMAKELKLSDIQKPFVAAEVTKYLVARNTLIPFKREVEEWKSRSNHNLFDFHRS